MDEEILTIREVADLLKLHPKTVNKFVISGKLPAYRIGRQWRFRKSEVLKLLEKENTWARPVNFEEVANQIGLSVPPEVLARANKVIKWVCREQRAEKTGRKLMKKKSHWLAVHEGTDWRVITLTRYFWAQ
jgi:excisionase family DNA binding protein